MLILALGAVVVGCVFLVVSFLTENIAWAWGCIAACGLAAVVLVVDTIRRGRAPREEAVHGEGPEQAVDAEEPSGDVEASLSAPVLAAALPDDAASTQVLTVTEAPTQAIPIAGPAVAEPVVDADVARPDLREHDEPEPDEEDVDAADALAVGGLSDEVVVVDEHPRFHLRTCPWLADRATLPLPVGEAVELGFTGCARCKPSTTLAAQSRAR